MKSRGEAPDLPHWTECDQSAAASNIRAAKDTASAVRLLRGEQPLSRELRDALADLLEGRIKLKRGPRPKGIFAEGTPATEIARRGWNVLVAQFEASGLTRDQALRKLLKLLGLDEYEDFDRLDNFLKAKRRRP